MAAAAAAAAADGGAAAAAGGPIVLIASDGVRVGVTAAQARLVPYVTDILGEDVEAGELDVTGVTGPILTRVAAFLAHRVDVPCPRAKKPLRDRTALEKNGLDAWYVTYITGIPILEVFDVLRAADFLNLAELMDLASARLAFHYLQWSAYEKKAIFFAGRDLTPEEEAKLREEHKWAEEDPEMDAELAAAAAAVGAART